MAICGWCKSSNLQRISAPNALDDNGQALETHNVPTQRRKCDGHLTSPYFMAKPKRK